MQCWREQEGAAEQEGPMASQAMAMVNIRNQFTTRSQGLRSMPCHALTQVGFTFLPPSTSSVTTGKVSCNIGESWSKEYIEVCIQSAFWCTLFNK